MYSRSYEACLEALTHLSGRMLMNTDIIRKMLSLKRELHMDPELSGREFRTSKRIRMALDDLPGLKILPLPVAAGVLAQIRGAVPGPETLLRADIDALPQTEEYKSPWKSRNSGVMHACGHDFHTAALVGAAQILSRCSEEGTLRGTVDLLFQPAEEGTTGARTCIDAGLFDLIHPERCFGMHNWPSVNAGKIVIHEGPLMSAKRNFTLTVQGAGGHGSMPHLNTDPIVCAAAIVQSLQTVISRNMNPLDAAVLSINMIQGGSPVNLVVENVILLGTIRSLSEAALSRAIERIETITGKTAQAYECGCHLDWKERIPAVVNHPDMCAIARIAAQKAIASIVSWRNSDSDSLKEMLPPDPGISDAPPSLASEDFALFASHVPSFFYWIGSHTPGEKVEELHRPSFHTDDRALSLAAQLYAESALLSSVSDG